MGSLRARIARLEKLLRAEPWLPPWVVVGDDGRLHYRNQDVTDVVEESRIAVKAYAPGNSPDDLWSPSEGSVA